MLFRIVLCALSMLAGTCVHGDEIFNIFAPDKKNQQLLSVVVRTTTDGVSTEFSEPLDMSFRPTSIAVNHDGKRMIVSSTSKSDKGGFPVANLEILESGKLRIVDVSTLPEPTGYTSFDRSGRYFMSANYASGNVNVYRIKASGSVGKRVCSLKTPRTDAHCILTTPDNRFAYVPCVKNNNALYQFKFDSETGQLSPLEPFDASPPAMFGPRHVAYHPSLSIAYFSNEQQLGVSVYEIGDDGQLTDKQHAVTMPRHSPFEQGKRNLHASDLVITPNGNLLFVAVRDFEGDEDSVFTFGVGADGRLRQLARIRVGNVPWKLDLSPDGKYLLVSETFDQRLSIFKIHDEGNMTQSAQVDWNAEVRDMVVFKSP